MSSEKVIDVEQFLKDAKISDKAEYLKSREITIEELCEFDNEELQSFAINDLKLDALSKNRFIKAISKHQKPAPSTTPGGFTGLSMNYRPATHHVIVSPAEHNGITKLYQQYDKSSALSQTLQNSVLSLNESQSIVINEIEQQFKYLYSTLQQKKESLLSLIDQQQQIKKQSLNQQLTEMENYINIVSNGKNKYEEYVSDSSLDMKRRKRLIVEMSEKILKQGATQMVTAPKLQFNLEKQEKSLNKFVLNAMSINDCDQPRAPLLSIKKKSATQITIEYELHENDRTGPKKIEDIGIEYAILPKSYTMKSKRKSGDSDSDDTKSDDSSESDDDTDSDSDDDTDSDGDDIQIDDIDINSIKWTEIDKKIKYKKHKKRNKYKIEDLKDNRAYMIRVRAYNSSGWGQYSEILTVITKKLVIDSKLLNRKQKALLMKWVPKGNKSKWKLIYAARKNGFTGSGFHSICNGKAPTVCIIKSQQQHIFGGYTEVAWSSSNAYRSDPNSFIYLLQSKRGDKPEKWTCKNTSYSVYHHSSYGPTFGGYDFYLCNNCNTTNSSYANLGHSYNAPRDNNKLAGSYNFKVLDYEVFQITRK